MTDERNEDARLEDLFRQARATPPVVSAALMARVAADAQRMQPAQRAAGWRAWLGAMGGMPGLGGLVTASCLGFWLGVAPPAAMPDLAGTLIGVESAEETEAYNSAGVSAFGWDIEEDMSDG